MALFAEPINPDVINQIKAREKLLGAGLRGSPLGTRNPGIIQAQNSTAWLRLASSVNVEGSSAYAKNTILSGGTQSEGAALKAGLQGSYDLDPELGYRPMAGIQSVDFEYYNNGALAKADIQLTCYTPEQFNRIEALFLRPGYSVLVEWGHTSYTTNGSDIVFYENASSPALSAFLNGGVDSEDITKKILEERKNTNYNYEGFHGVVVNFNWSYNSDNSYSITVKTITQGSIIESLKINNATPEKLQDNATSKAEKAAADEAKNKTEAEGGASVLDDALSATGDKIGTIVSSVISGVGNLLEGAKNLIGDLWFLDGIDDSTWLSKLKTKGDTSQIHRFLFDIAVNFQAISAGEDTGTGIIEKSTVNSAGTPFVKLLNPITEKPEAQTMLRINFDVDSEDDQDMGNFQYYITMGAFLEIFKNNFLPKIENGKNYVDIDNNLANTPMITFPGQFSADPLICLIPINGFPNKDLVFEGNYAMLNELKKIVEFYPFSANSNQLLDLMQVYLNFNYIMEVVENTVDEEGNAPLIEFLKNLLAGVNKALGGVNKFGTRIIEDSPDGKKVISIYDEGAHIRTNNIPPTLLKPYGINKSGGSTFTAIDFQSELSNEFASMISIGAQVDGNQVGENATAFSQFNKDLKDRITPVKTTGANTSEGKTETPEQKFKTTLTTIDTALKKIYKNFQIQKDNIETLTSANTTYAPYLVGHFTEKGASPAPFFIPFNLSFTLKGIAGIRIFDKLYLEDNILPMSYRGKVAFLAKNVKHSVDNNNWTTTIETLTIPTSGKTVPISITLGEAIKGEPIIQEYPEVNDDQVEATAGTNAKSIYGGPPGKGGQTLIQKNTLGQIYYTGPTEKSIIVLHHTAGAGNARDTIAGWNTRTDRVSTHFVLEKSGNYDQLYDYKAWGNHVGITEAPFKRVGAIFQNFNKTTIGIEIINIGPLVLRSGKLINTYAETAIKKAAKANNTKLVAELFAKAKKYTLGVDAVKSVDANGNEAPYKTCSYWEKYPEAQLLGLEKILKDIIAKNPKCRITYDFDDYFPPQGTESANAIKGVTGTYTHNSFKQGKVDVGPVPEIIALLKRLSEAPSVKVSIIDQVIETLDTVFNPTLTAIAKELIGKGSINYQQEIAAKDAAIISIQRYLDTVKSNPVLKKNLEATLIAADTVAGKGWNKQYLAYLAWLFGSRKPFWSTEPKFYYQSSNTFDATLENRWEVKLDEWMKRVKATPIKSDL